MDVRVGDILLMKKKHPCGGENSPSPAAAWILSWYAAPAAREIMIPVPRPNAISKKSPTRRSSSGALCH